MESSDQVMRLLETHGGVGRAGHLLWFEVWLSPHQVKLQARKVDDHPQYIYIYMYCIYI